MLMMGWALGGVTEELQGVKCGDEYLVVIFIADAVPITGKVDHPRATIQVKDRRVDPVSKVVLGYGSPQWGLGGGLVVTNHAEDNCGLITRANPREINHRSPHWKVCDSSPNQNNTPVDPLY